MIRALMKIKQELVKERPGIPYVGGAGKVSLGG